MPPKQSRYYGPEMDRNLRAGMSMRHVRIGEDAHNLANFNTTDPLACMTRLPGTELAATCWFAKTSPFVCDIFAQLFTELYRDKITNDMAPKIAVMSNICTAVVWPSVKEIKDAGLREVAIVPQSDARTDKPHNGATHFAFFAIGGDVRIRVGADEVLLRGTEKFNGSGMYILSEMYRRIGATYDASLNTRRESKTFNFSPDARLVVLRLHLQPPATPTQIAQSSVIVTPAATSTDADEPGQSFVAVPSTIEGL